MLLGGRLVVYCMELGSNFILFKLEWKELYKVEHVGDDCLLEGNFNIYSILEKHKIYFTPTNSQINKLIIPCINTDSYAMI